MRRDERGSTRRDGVEMIIEGADEMGRAQAPVSYYFSPGWFRVYYIPVRTFLGMFYTSWLLCLFLHDGWL